MTFNVKVKVSLEDALKRAYYYAEDGDWRGPEVDEWSR
jgi:hypothetical protein